jgi:hypothetical protein
MDIEELIALMASSAQCAVRTPVGQPAGLDSSLQMPRDLARFYELCGGAELFISRHYGIRISSPSELIPSNIAVLGRQYEDDISSTWFVIGSTPDNDFISIDLSPGRNGLCYDSFHENHGIIGSSPIIALSFTELLERLFESGGGYWYWLRPDFEALGDAYDPRTR